MSWIKSSKPVKLNEAVYSNECSPVLTAVNIGRSNKLNENMQTSQIQCLCVKERPLSYSKNR